MRKRRPAFQEKGFGPVSFGIFEVTGGIDVRQSGILSAVLLLFCMTGQERC